MLFVNNTPFPAIAWTSLDKMGRNYASVTARGRFRFDTANDTGLWPLKLDPDQGELRGEDCFYDNDPQASVLLESDYVPYKPAADLIVNALAHSPDGEPAKRWLCGVRAVRIEPDPERQEADVATLLAKTLQVTGPRQWEAVVQSGRKVWRLSEPEPVSQVPLRYENAFSGQLRNSRWEETNDPAQEKYLVFDERNPLGRGIVHDSLLEGDAPLARH